MKLALWIAVALAAPLAAWAAPPPKAAPTPSVSELVVIPDKTVSGVDVVAPKNCLKAKYEIGQPRAKVVSSYPTPGARVRPGLLLMRFTFDRPMTCSGFIRGDGERRDPCPTHQQNMLLSLDRTTLWTLCVTEPNQPFAVWLNRRLSQDFDTLQPVKFVSLAGHEANPYHLEFETGDGPPVTTTAEALAQDPVSAGQLHLKQD